MSAPDTNISRQQRQHKGPLGGMAAGVGFVAVLLVVFLGYIWFSGSSPDGAETQVEVGAGMEVTEPENPVPAGAVD